MGQILDVVDALGNGDVMVMLSTDHGGEGWLHGRNQDEDLIIPLFIKGANFSYLGAIVKNNEVLDIEFRLGCLICPVFR